MHWLVSHWLVSLAAAQDPLPSIPLVPKPDLVEPLPMDLPPPLPPAEPEPEEVVAPKVPVIELTGIGLQSDDIEVFVRYDGNLYWGDLLVLKPDLEKGLGDYLNTHPDARVVISADTGAPYEALVYVVQLARDLGAERTALAVEGFDLPQEADPLFPKADAEVEPLDGGLTTGDVKELRPKRYKFPQNPYGNTTSYTAYTLERGETKIGPGSVAVGIIPRLQIGTAPLLDAVGAFNVNVKANLTRKGPFDGALLAQYYRVPVQGLVTAVGFGDWFDGRKNSSDTLRASYLGLGATGSLQILPPWSIHTQVYWARPSATGDIRFDDVPEVLLPGVKAGNTAMVGLGITGDLTVLNLATDYRFNRRDSVFLWLRYPFYGRVRGLTNPKVQGLPGSGNTDIIVAYGNGIAFADSYSIAGGYQGSWKHVEARVGLGVSAVRLTWLLQAFELSYKFGGTSRRQERDIRRGFGAMDEQ